MTTPTHAPAAPTHLYLTDDDDACRLLASNPAAFVIGFILDQQVTVQKAFRGPFDLLHRVGTIDPAQLAAMDPAKLEAAFIEKPALHRFPGAMARRVQKAMQQIVDDYDGDAGRVWSTAADTDEVWARFRDIPGFGDGKILSVVAVLAQQLGMPFDGWQSKVSPYGTLGDVDSHDALKAYQTRKRAAKRAARDKAAASPAAK